MVVVPFVRSALVDWLVTHRAVDHLEVPLPFVMSRARPDDGAARAAVARPTTECWTIEEAVRALWDDATPVPGSVAVLLGVPAATTFATVVRLLAQAHDAQPDSTWSRAALRLACGDRAGPWHERTQAAS